MKSSLLAILVGALLIVPAGLAAAQTPKNYGQLRKNVVQACENLGAVDEPVASIVEEILNDVAFGLGPDPWANLTHYKRHIEILEIEPLLYCVRISDKDGEFAPIAGVQTPGDSNSWLVGNGLDNGLFTAGVVYVVEGQLKPTSGGWAGTSDRHCNEIPCTTINLDWLNLFESVTDFYFPEFDGIYTAYDPTYGEWHFRIDSNAGTHTFGNIF